MLNSLDAGLSDCLRGQQVQAKAGNKNNIVIHMDDQNNLREKEPKPMVMFDYKNTALNDTML